MRPAYLIAWVFVVPIYFAIAGCGQDEPHPTKPQVAPAAESANKVEALENALGPDDLKTFAGADRLPIGGPLASISIPQSEDEKQFMAQFGCYAETDCYGPKHFERYILKTYADVGAIRFKLPPDLADEDKDDVERTRQDCRRGLYFAKLITLANGVSLFDLLTRCSKNVSPFNWAEITRDAKAGTTYFDMQFFPVLRQDATGREVELNILLTRRGERIDATSLAFSSSVLRDADFMTKHGVSCWKA
jgi:hypothetical protein